MAGRPHLRAAGPVTRRPGGLAGFALNLDDGRVQVVAEGQRENCHRLLEWLRSADTPGRVDGVTEIWGTPRGGYDGFAIR
ncbi:acylphosphatase [Streptomyces goshikiensis]|uniref:acylphosphatase n=1 Tax=Streptomyces goshikiensis TaxID=1942 RepID=UPI00365B6F14